MELTLKEEKVYKRHPFSAEMTDFCEDYKVFLDEAKTERESVDFMVELAEKNGFKEYKRGTKLNAGDKIYSSRSGRAMFLAVIGTEHLNEGINLIASHIDTPAIHIRTKPLYEEGGMAFFKSHYYGGIKKYQWLALPLEMRGVVFKKDGEKVIINVGKDKTDPVLVITDLLPHLGKDQMTKTAAELVTGEQLNILLGTIESENAEKDKTKQYILELLNEKYGITEEDFLSAELTIVPESNARDVGLDRSMLGAYGHDDRVCAFTSARALFDMTEIPEKTAVCALVDKEEIGSEGLTGMKSQAFDLFIEDLCEEAGARLRVCYSNSFCISADVCNAFDPNFADVSEKRNDGKLSNGFALVKYTGARGKSGASDASAELMSKMRILLDNADVVWQTGQLGKVDQGGGGTVAGMLAERNIQTVDGGVPVLAMHAPFEIVAKADVYMTYKAYKAFYEKMK